MKNKFSIIVFVLSVIITFSSCKVAPKEIKYGTDHCLFCDMTVVDQSHSAEYVTKKGKAFMFDSVECLVMKINKDGNEEDLAFILVADYEKPGVLVDAKTATFLISKKIKSPMGANLSAFLSKETAETYLKNKGGKLYTWNELKIKFAD